MAKVCIVGRPNVGKSTLFNRIVGERISITDDQPGITRDRIYSKATWLNRTFNLIDTGGIELSDQPFQEEIKAQAMVAILEADVIIFLCDARNGLLKEDEIVTKILYKSNKPVVLAINKVDDQKFKDLIYDFYALGLGDPIPISSAHGIGIGDLLDRVIELLPEDNNKDYGDEVVKFCVIGRPNVGKSSLVNTILGTERVIVSNIEGTTRDSVDTEFQRDNQKYVIIDTAGIKKSGRIFENADKYALIRALDALDRSDLCLVVIDAEKGILEQDKHIAGYAKDASKAVILVVNKWDLASKDDKSMKEFELKMKENFQFLDYAKICYVSALKNKRIHTIFQELKLTLDSYERRIPTSLLNECLTDAVAMNIPGLTKKGRAKFYYATQVGVKPPTFVLFVNDPELIHFSYQRYLENQLRKNFDFDGSPIKLIFRKRE